MNYSQINIRPLWLCLIGVLLLGKAQAKLPEKADKEEIKHVKHIIEILNHPSLTSIKKADSIANYQHSAKYWKRSEYGCEALMPLFRQNLNNVDNIEEEYAWVNLVTIFLKSCGTLGERVIMAEKRIALASALKDTSKLALSYQTLANVYRSYEMYDQELEYSTKAIRMLLNMPDIDHGSIAHHTNFYGYHLSQIAYQRNDSNLLDSALKYTAMSFEHAKKTGSFADPAIVHAITLARADKRREAINVALHSFNYVRENGGRYYQFRFARQLSSYYAALNQRDSAFYWIKKCFDIERPGLENNDPNTIDLGYPYGLVELNSLNYLINIHTELQEYNEAAMILDKLLYSNFPKEESSMTPFFRKLAANVYMKNGAFKKAAENYKLSLIQADKKRKELADNFLEANQAHTEVQIKLQKEKAATQQMIAEKENQKHRFQRNTVLAGAGGLVLFLLFVYNRFRVAKKQKSLIEKQKERVMNAHDQLKLKNEEILDSITYAKRLQNSIMPPASIFEESFNDAFLFYLPKDIIGGDFYFAEKTEEAIYVAAADCTGHGVPGAMVSVVCSTALTKAIIEDGLSHPDEILERTRKLVTRQFERNEEGIKDGMDIALVKISESKDNAGLYDIEYAGANTPLWVFKGNVTGEEKAVKLQADKQPIGEYVSEDPFSNHKLQLNKGDTLYLFSDGYYDQFGGIKGKKFKPKQLMKLLLSVTDQPLNLQKDALQKAFTEWKGDNEQVDDVCVVGIRL